MNRILGIDEIHRLLPHRHPFLFLTGAQLISEDEICGTAVWPEDHPIFSGHFPFKPIVPGVCQIESAAQLAGVHVSSRLNKEVTVDRSDMLGVLASVRNASFYVPVAPVEVLNLSCRVRELSDLVFHVKAQGKVGNSIAFGCELVFAIRSVLNASSHGSQIDS